MELVHYRESLYVRRIRLKSNTIKTEGTLCSNGSYHAIATRIKNQVTCPICKKFLEGS